MRCHKEGRQKVRKQGDIDNKCNLEMTGKKMKEGRQKVRKGDAGYKECDRSVWRNVY